MTESGSSGNLKGTWNQAILTFLLPILLVMGLRWAVVEPFVIPSGSMIPNLLVYDHILVKKFYYGLHWPFSTRWMVKWREPQRGEVLVFRYPENPDVYYIKRLIGLPGDHVLIEDGRITINGEKWELTPLENSELSDSGTFNYFQESIPQSSDKHIVRFFKDRPFGEQDPRNLTVPENQYLFMGDNRDQSSDGRVWGFVRDEYIVGKSWLIWLSCHSTLPTISYVCDPAQIRWDRLFKVLH